VAITNTLRLEGIVPIIPTPFATGEKVDWPALHRLMDFARMAGVSAVCLPAYASEFYKLSEAERLRLVREAVQQAAGRIPVFAQVNLASATQAIEVIREAQDSGASAIAAAVPRMIASSERDLYRYFDRILSSMEIPLLIQDWNPSGPTVTPQFVSELHRAHNHFRWIKLEEPLMSAKSERDSGSNLRGSRSARRLGRYVHAGPDPRGDLWSDAGPRRVGPACESV
jgi:dihydrodipicolinate synthase/N-acetylneuraminate lyase